MDADYQRRTTTSEYETMFVTNAMHSCHLKSIKMNGRKLIEEVASINQRAGVFELLVAVAGELLQDGHIGKVNPKTNLGQPESIKSIKASKERPGEAVKSTPSPISSTEMLSSNESVKLSITSFNVPELLIDLPESATVASLKNAVMDATTDLLSGGLSVRVCLNGSKVHDENATLAQIGISHVEKLNSLNFMLEPAVSSSSGDPLHVLSNAATTRPLLLYKSRKAPMHENNCHHEIASGAKTGWGKRTTEADATHVPKLHLSKPAPRSGKKKSKRDAPLRRFSKQCKKPFQYEGMPVPQCSKTIACISSLVPVVSMSMGNCPGKQDGVSCMELYEQYPGAYPLAPGIVVQHPDHGIQNMEELGLVTIRSKPLMLGGNKRRMRRPFSIREVEALVFAVEKLGLGRWRDIKLWAFDQVKHRTYVDLKDKWKTLVHTARIAPHQRRGEQVPQELLERVIQAQTYWSMQHAKEL